MKQKQLLDTDKSQRIDRTISMLKEVFTKVTTEKEGMLRIQQLEKSRKERNLNQK